MSSGLVQTEVSPVKIHSSLASRVRQIVMLSHESVVQSPSVRDLAVDMRHDRKYTSETMLYEVFVLCERKCAIYRAQRRPEIYTEGNIEKRLYRSLRQSHRYKKSKNVGISHADSQPSQNTIKSVPESIIGSLTAPQVHNLHPRSSVQVQRGQSVMQTISHGSKICIHGLQNPGGAQTNSRPSDE